MFNGWPASYADIVAGLTFARDVGDQVKAQLVAGDRFISILLGPSGVGKTTAIRQAIAKLVQSGFLCWEHKSEQTLLPDIWRSLAGFLKSNNLVGCLFVDDAHVDLVEVNDLVDFLVADGNNSLRLILASSKNQWYPRVKTPALHKSSIEYYLYRVQGNEIDRLLNLVENVTSVRALVDSNFLGFSREERRRRLTQRCEADMFVCLKNIFSSEKLDDIILREDDIILREYATLAPPCKTFTRS
jgi:replication-associated recombination protein RarA